MDSRGSRNYSNKTTKTIVKTQPNNKQYNNIPPFNKNYPKINPKTKPQSDTSSIILGLVPLIKYMVNNKINMAINKNTCFGCSLPKYHITISQ